jgi:hypothetical protein
VKHRRDAFHRPSWPTLRLVCLNPRHFGLCVVLNCGFRQPLVDYAGGYMIVKRISVRNFRSIRAATVEVGGQIAIVGGNGAGKSTLLRAVDRFYTQSSAVEADDFFARLLTEPIEIELTFSSFTASEREMFSSRIHRDEMTVVRVFEANGGRNNGRYYGVTSQHLGFAAIRAAQGAQASRTAYAQVRVKVACTLNCLRSHAETR